MRAQTPDYLFRRGNWFYFRRGIPLQLRRRLASGKNHFNNTRGKKGKPEEPFHARR